MSASCMRIVLLGKTGAGKSSFAETLLGKTFKKHHTAVSGTSECQIETNEAYGRTITLTDTPGFFDSNKSEEKMKPEIVKCVTECSPGPHAFLILLKVERFTVQENEVISKIKESFSEKAFKHAVVVFTHGDQLPDGMKIEQFVGKNEKLRDLLEKCGGRFHVVDNTYWKNNQQDEYRNNQVQVEALLNTIDRMIEANGGGCYTNEMLQEVERKIQEEGELIRQTAGNMHEEEIRAKAKGKVRNILKKMTVTTGMLLGAFLDVPLAVSLFIAVMKKLRKRGIEDPQAGTSRAAGCHIRSQKADKTDEAVKNTGVRKNITGVTTRKMHDVPGTVSSVIAEIKKRPTGRTEAAQAADRLSGQVIGCHIRSSPAGKAVSVAATATNTASSKRLVLLGKPAVGKSSLANTILGESVFKINHGWHSKGQTVTMMKEVHGRTISLTDTPGFIDSHMTEEEMKSAIMQCITECSPGPHAFLIVLKVERFTDQENEVISKIEESFSEEAFKHAVVVFTHGDLLPHGMKIEEFVGENTKLCNLLEKCGGRCHVVDNKYWKNNQQDEYRNNQVQVEALLNTIDRMIGANGGYYTNKMLQEVERKIQEEDMH